MSLLDQLEIEIAQRLESFPLFATLTVHAEPQKNIVEEIAHKIGKLRTLVAPLVSAADDSHPNVLQPYFDDIMIDVGVFQNPTIAAGDPSPRRICEETHLALKGWKPDSLSNVITARKPGISYSAQAGQLNIWNCAFATKGGLIAELPKVGTPSAVVTATVTLGTVTAGAAIFYTTNGSNPAPLNGTLYLSAFVKPAAGTNIKARAFLAGYLNSQVLSIIT